MRIFINIFVRFEGVGEFVFLGCLVVVLLGIRLAKRIIIEIVDEFSCFEFVFVNIFFDLIEPE